MDSITKQTRALGKAYGLLANALPKIVGRADRVTRAALNPMYGFGEAHRLVMVNHAMTDRLADQIGELLDLIDPQYPQDTASIPDTARCAWWLGYKSVMTT